MTSAPVTSTPVRVSLREIRECAFRALSAHGASHGEAWTASRLVLEASVLDVSAIGALVDDLAQAPWSRTHQKAAAGYGKDDLCLGSYAINRVLREGPLAIDLVCGETDLNSVAAPCAVAAPSIVDMLLLELAVVRGLDVSAVVSVGTTTGESAGTSGSSSAQTLLRVARPDGALGVAHLEPGTQQFPELSGLGENHVGVLGLGHDPRASEFKLSWITPDERTAARAKIAAHGLEVPHELWAGVYVASRRYLVPD